MPRERARASGLPWNLEGAKARQERKRTPGWGAVRAERKERAAESGGMDSAARDKSS